MIMPMQTHLSESGPTVGIYFVVDDVVLLDAVPVESGEPYGSAIQHGGHYAFWESFAPDTPPGRRFKARAYDAYPRGRVVYFPTDRSFIIYRDPCLSDRALAAVTRHFNLAGQTIRIEQDEHYQCAGCNPFFLD